MALVAVEQEQRLQEAPTIYGRKALVRERDHKLGRDDDARIFSHYGRGT